MTDTVVAEGQVKFRDGKKWKTRWVVVRKPSPVADCLSVLVYKEKKKGKEKGKERLNVTLEGICGVELGPGYDGVSFTLSILCLAHMLVLGFHSREALLAWDARIRYSLGEVHSFGINVEPGTKLESGPASLHLCNNLLALARGLPPIVVGHWKLSALRRYGAVPNGFVFEGGTRCGYWAGVFFLSCSEGEQISFLFDCIVRGITPSRAPQGLRPALPADPSADPAQAEERISQEASDLEKRLSMLSQCSLASSTASTYSCRTSVAGDDRSSISSSSSSQSDTSYGGRLPYWVEPLAKLHLSSETASSSSTLKAMTSSDERLYAAVMSRPSSAQLHSRGLHDSGRQSSLDSGIGIATGSQSSYSGSYSSYIRSLDMAGHGGGEEFGSLGSLPARPPSSPFSAPLPNTPPPVFQPESRPSTSCSCASRSSSRTSQRHGDDYQIPGLLRPRYDTPRSLLQILSPRDPAAKGVPFEPGSGGDGACGLGQKLTSSPAERRAQRQAMMQRSHSWGSERAPSVDSEGRSTPRKPLPPGSMVSEDEQGSQAMDNYITPEQWRSVRSRCLMQLVNSPSSPRPPADTEDPPPRTIDTHGYIRNKLTGLLTSLSPPPPSAPPPPPVALKPAPTCGAFQAAPPDSSANYVNIPTSPPPAKTSRERLYTELDLQASGSARSSRASLPPHPDEGPISYAHLDIAAMATAQKVGAEHVQGREERLTQTESRQRGPPN